MSLERALLDAIPFLQNLPRARGLEESGLAQLATFRVAHPEVEVDLVVDRPPGSPDVDFDLLLQGPADGTIAIGWRPDANMPWSVRYSEHWAANLVVSVNGLDVTIQDALQAVRLSRQAGSDLPARLVDHCLIATAIMKDPPPVSDSEVQDAADGFRLARGLHSVESTARWLAESGLSVERFEAFVKTTVQARKLKERITREQIASQFMSQAGSLAIVTVVRAHSRTEGSLPDLTGAETAIADLLERALASRSIDDDLGVKICIETGFISEVFPSFPPESAAPPVGTTVGPVKHNGEYWSGRVLRRWPPRLNSETNSFIQDRLFALWLEGERAKAKIKWHWM